jgi:hypothetical protein
VLDADKDADDGRSITLPLSPGECLLLPGEERLLLPVECLCFRLLLWESSQLNAFWIAFFLDSVIARCSGSGDGVVADSAANTAACALLCCLRADEDGADINLEPLSLIVFLLGDDTLLLLSLLTVTVKLIFKGAELGIIVTDGGDDMSNP